MKIGDEVVIGLVLDEGRISPLFHNSTNSPAHPCRGTVVKIGRKIVQVSSGTKRPWPCRIEREEGSFCAFPVDEAKDLYRNAFFGREGNLSIDTINAYVEAL